MRFDPKAIVLLVVAAAAASWRQVDAFAPPLASAGVTRCSQNAMVRKPFVSRRTQTTRRFMVDSDDEVDSDDYGEDPLGEGVDSVAWLPTVAGAKNKDISTAREVSGRLKLIDRDFSGA